MTHPATRPWSRRTVLAAAFALVCGGCSREDGRRSEDQQAPSSGIRGVTDIDAGCPATPDAASCNRRPVSARLRFVPQDRDAPEVHIRTGDDGWFTVRLPPGRYVVVPDDPSGRPFPRADPMTVEVRQATYTTITVGFTSRRR